MSRRSNKLKNNPNNFKLLKSDPDVVCKEDIEKIFELLDEEKDQHDINELMPHVSKRQIKLIRWIKKNDDEESINKLKTGTYNISRLKSNLVLKKQIERFVYEILFTDRYNFSIKVEHHVFKKNKGLHWKGINAIKTYVKSKMLEAHHGKETRVVDFSQNKK